MTRILQLSDTHIVDPGELAYGVVDTGAALEAAVRHINRISDRIGPLDGVLVTGDLTDFGTASEYRRFRDITAELPGPLWVLPGNHDDREEMRRAFADDPLMPGAGPINWHVALADFDLIGLDSTVPGQPYGELPEESLDWLHGRLDQIAGRPVLIGIHHPPFETGLGHMDRQRLRTGDAFLDVLARHDGPVTVTCGHVHRFMVAAHGDITLMIAPSPSHAVTLDLRPHNPGTLTEETPGMVLHDWRDGRFVSQFVAIGDFGTPSPFDVAPPRA